MRRQWHTATSNSLPSIRKMDRLADLGTKPLFQLIALAIVLLLTDLHFGYGVAAAGAWTLWIWLSRRSPLPGMR